MTTADLLGVIAICVSAAGVGVSYRFAKRADHRELARAEDERVKEAEERGRKEALRDAEIAGLKQQIEHQREESDPT